jgi:hypothetical protein
VNHARPYPKTPEEAKRDHVGFYAPGRTCENGHFAMRRVEDGKCVRCLHNEERGADMARGM